MKKIVLMAVLGLALSACASKTTAVDKEAQLTQNWSVERLYSEAQQELNDSNYTRAVKLYEILQSRFPNTRQATQSQLETAYAYYKDEQQPQALAHLERFERLNPHHPNSDYALYLKGLITLNEDQSFLSRFAMQDWSDRDPKAHRDAYIIFNELVTRYPDSKYAADSREKMARLVDALGGHEIAVARYYMQRGAYLAAANRAQNIVTHYQNTRYVEEALAIMTTAYAKMAHTQLHEDAHRVLAQNFPNSPYLQNGWQADNAPWWRYWK